MRPERSRRFEPWPLLLAGMLAGMIGVSLSFYWVASHHPDPLVTSAPRPGVED